MLAGVSGQLLPATAYLVLRARLPLLQPTWCCVPVCPCYSLPGAACPSVPATAYLVLRDSLPLLRPTCAA